MTRDNTPTTFDIADTFLEKWCALNPLAASEEGFKEYDNRVGDLAPTSAFASADLARTTLVSLRNSPTEDFHERLCADVLTDFCEDLIDEVETNDWIRGINVIVNPLDTIHETCYNIDEDDPAAQESRTEKISRIPAALESFKETLHLGIVRECLPRRTQLAHIADNCLLYAKDPLFVDEPAGIAYAAFGEYMRSEIIPYSMIEDAVGRETYERFVPRHLGKTIDIRETYEWGWEEIHSIFDELNEVIEELNPGHTYTETLAMLMNDKSRTKDTPEEFQEFLQNLLDESVEQLDGVHFDIDPRLKTVQACMLEEAGNSAMFYSGPSDDFSRPGRTYYPINGKKTFPLWEEVTTCYHEGLPGHHLHVGTVKCMGDNLSEFQKTIAWNTGETEGWALYAERLMVELGFNNDPAYVFGMLNASLLRATRVVMDIGLHCGYAIPGNAPEEYPRGEKWNENLAISVMKDVIGASDIMARDEVHRYLGWIAQAISYKIGERTIRNIRERERYRLGFDFSLKEFHSRLLGYGHVGLGRLEDLFDPYY